MEFPIKDIAVASIYRRKFQQSTVHELIVDWVRFKNRILSCTIIVTSAKKSTFGRQPSLE